MTKKDDEYQKLKIANEILERRQEKKCIDKNTDKTFFGVNSNLIKDITETSVENSTSSEKNGIVNTKTNFSADIKNRLLILLNNLDSKLLELEEIRTEIKNIIT